MRLCQAYCHFSTMRLIFLYNTVARHLDSVDHMALKVLLNRDFHAQRSRVCHIFNADKTFIT